MNKHIPGDECPSCNDKLGMAHPEMKKWFIETVKPKNPNCHISWSYRDENSQNDAVAQGRSKLKFPLSAHNKTDAQGNPCSRALDLFEMGPNGQALWSWKYFEGIAQWSHFLPICWGGHWRALGDSDHFELHHTVT